MGGSAGRGVYGVGGAGQRGGGRAAGRLESGRVACGAAILAELAGAHKLVVTVEDNGVSGGIGSAVSAMLRHNEIDVPCRDIGVPQQFLAHASRKEVFAEIGLTAADVARRITGWVAAQGAPAAEPEVSERLD